MHRRPNASTRKRHAITATVATAALTGSALLAPPVGAHEAEPTGVAPAAPQPPVETPATTPPSVPVGPPVELPPEEVPVGLPAVELPAAPAVRSGFAVDVPAAPATELPLAPETDRSGPPAPGAGEPTARAEAPRRREHQTRPAADAPRTAPKAPPGARASSATAAAAPPPPSQHTVIAGEHLWSIATMHVAAATGRAPDSVSAADVASYWTRLCLLNEARLQSGDVNLVYPGEVLELPPA